MQGPLTLPPQRSAPRPRMSPSSQKASLSHRQFPPLLLACKISRICILGASAAAFHFHSPPLPFFMLVSFVALSQMKLPRPSFTILQYPFPSSGHSWWFSLLPPSCSGIERVVKSGFSFSSIVGTKQSRLLLIQRKTVGLFGRKTKQD